MTVVEDVAEGVEVDSHGDLHKLVKLTYRGGRPSRIAHAVALIYKITMDPGLHAKQGLNHLSRVLNYAKFVAEDGAATVHLTYEDWHVLADTLFHMDMPRELVPDLVSDYRLAEGHDAILISTEGCEISVEMM